MVRRMKLELVGVAEIADLLGVSRQRVHAIIRAYDDFPDPVAELSAGRIWLRSDVDDWIVRHSDRRPGRPS